MKRILIILFAFIASNLQGQNKVESSIEEFYNNGTWQNSAGTNYQYDANNNLNSETRYSWDSPGWIANMRSQYTYNVNNKATTRTEQNWNTITNQFDNEYKTTYSYDGTGKLITILDQDWMSGSWVNTFKTDITYSGNLISTAISTKWVGSQWINDFKYTASYSGIYINQWLNEKWNGSQWINENRNILIYNANNKKSSNRLDAWTGTTWSEAEITNFVFDTNGNTTSRIDSKNGVLDGKLDYTYDGAVLMSSFANPFKDKTGVDYIFEEFPHVNKVLNSIYYNYQITTSSYALNTRKTYNYANQLVLNTNNFAIKNIKLYPNPATSFFEISGLTGSEKIKIYDLLGKKVFENTINANEKINIQNFSKGLYLLYFENGSSIKFIKE